MRQVAPAYDAAAARLEADIAPVDDDRRQGIGPGQCRPALWRAQHTLAVSTLRRRKKGRDTVVGVPSRFIAEMKLDEAKTKEDPRERLKKMRDAMAAKVAAAPAPGG